MNLKERIKKQKVNGIFVKLIEHPALVTMAQEEGMDFMFYDCEHGTISYEKLHDLMVLGNMNDYPSIVRVAQLARGDISKILDYGASGVMVPMIEHKEEAEQLVAWSKYPPLGKRSYSGGANTHYAKRGNHEENMRQMNHRTMSIVQIETQTGVENIDEIVSVEGIDAIIIGPCDLAISMKNPDHVMDQRELDMIHSVAQACATHKKAFGIIGGMELLSYFKDHLDIFISCIDSNLLRSGLQQAVQEYEKQIDEKELI